MPPTRRTRNVPERSGDRFVEPPVRPTAERPAASIETLLDNNRLLRAAVDTRFGDLKFWELVAATRREVLTVAAEYTQSYRDAERPSDTADWIARPIIMGGHQPELFHPGVWLKNSALDAYARAVSGTAINLVVDTDRCVRASVGVPVGSPREAHVEEVPFDARAPEMAWEERPIVDRDLFASFGARGSALIAPLEPHPILRRWWPLAQERAAECHRLGLALSQARHALESRFGWETLEVPVSELVRLPTVMVFMGWLLAHARQFHDAYNTALSGYRRSHRVRGRGRPMPDLATRVDSSGEGPWFELPWWIWSRDDPRRRRVFADVSQPGALTLSDLETVRVELPIAPETSPAKWVDALSRLEEHALRLRPRAIVTTMLARLMIADVFVHGVGGAAYDQLTDSIVRQLTGCDAPRFAVVSGTLRLPCEAALPELAADPRVELAEVQRLLRDLEFHPERHLLPLGERSAEVRDLVRSKRHWIDTPATVTLGRRRCHEIRAANERLRSEVAGLRRAALERIGPLAARIKARDVLRSREYPWCFFAENSLRSFLLLEND